MASIPLVNQMRKKTLIESMKIEVGAVDQSKWNPLQCIVVKIGSTENNMGMWKHQRL